MRLGLTLWLLATVLTLLKLTELIDWSWVVIYAPIWVPVAFLLGCVVFILVCFTIAFGVVVIREMLRSEDKSLPRPPDRIDPHVH